MTTTAAKIVGFTGQEISMAMLTFPRSAVFAMDVDVVEVAVTTLHCFRQIVQHQVVNVILDGQFL